MKNGGAGGNYVLFASRLLLKSVEITQNPFWLPEGGTVASKAVIMHPDYNTRALRHRNVTEFYDYDIALVQVNESIPLSWKAR